MGTAMDGSRVPPERKGSDDLQPFRLDLDTSGRKGVAPTVFEKPLEGLRRFLRLDHANAVLGGAGMMGEQPSQPLPNVVRDLGEDAIVLFLGDGYAIKHKTDLHRPSLRMPVVATGSTTRPRPGSPVPLPGAEADPEDGPAPGGCCLRCDHSTPIGPSVNPGRPPRRSQARPCHQIASSRQYGPRTHAHARLNRAV
jgi:hypothetical protein